MEEFYHGIHALLILIVFLLIKGTLSILMYGKIIWNIVPAMWSNGKERANVQINKLSVLLIFVFLILINVLLIPLHVLQAPKLKLKLNLKLTKIKMMLVISKYQTHSYAQINLNQASIISTIKDLSSTLSCLQLKESFVWILNSLL